MAAVSPSQEKKEPQTSADTGNALRVGHVYLDVLHRKLHCLNQTASQLHDEGVPYTPGDLADHPLTTLAGEAVTADNLPLVTAWREGHPVEETSVLARPPGPEWRVSWSVSPVRDKDGEIIGIVGTVVCGPPEPDLRVLAELAHDLRTPLQALGMLVTILDAVPPVDAELRESLLKIRAAAGRALEVSRDLLHWCRHPSGSRRPVTPTWFALEPFLAGLADEQSAEAQRKKLVLDIDLTAARGWEVYTDRVRLGRLLSNLLNNAVRYTARGRVEFTAAWRQTGPEPMLALGVVDTGAGIEAEEQESIFEPFERGKAGKESDSGGSGLGLASVDNLVNELGLTLEVYSEHNRGSAFHLLLPASALRQTPAS